MVMRYDGITAEPLPGAGQSCAVFVTDLGNTIGVTIGPDGRLYVVSSGTREVRRYDADTGTPCPAPGQSGAVYAWGCGLQYVKGLKFGPDGHLYVADSDRNSILQFKGPYADSPGQYMGVFTSGADGQLYAPGGLAFGPDGCLYVAGNGSGNVVRFEGPLAQEPGQFVDVVVSVVNAMDLAFGDQRTLYISSQNTDSVYAFDLLDSSLELLPDPDHLLDQPQGLAAGPDCCLYVGSALAHKVARYCGDHLEQFIDCNACSPEYPPSFLAFAGLSDCDGNAIPDDCECGDLNGDGEYTQADFLAFIQAYGACATDPPPNRYNIKADMDCDGCITLKDYGLWLECYRNMLP